MENSFIPFRIPICHSEQRCGFRFRYFVFNYGVCYIWTFSKTSDYLPSTRVITTARHITPQSLRNVGFDIFRVGFLKIESLFAFTYVSRFLPSVEEISSAWIGFVYIPFVIICKCQSVRTYCRLIKLDCFLCLLRT